MTTTMTIGIPGIPCGNFASVMRMIQKCGGAASIVRDPTQLARFDKVIIAGVGAFDYGMTSLREGGWIDALNEAALVRRIPVLGICLGMQLLCASSEEGKLPGLGWVDAHVKRFAPPAQQGLKIPHMGWNTVRVDKPNPLIVADGEQRFYFVHAYHAVCSRREDVLGSTHYGSDFTAALSTANIYGVQFHPEKSHRFGMTLLHNFVVLPC